MSVEVLNFRFNDALIAGLSKFAKSASDPLPPPPDSSARTLILAIGQRVQDDIKDRIDTEKRAPDGGPWSAWSPKYARTRGPGDSLLLQADSKSRSDSLFNSVNVMEEGENVVDVGTGKIYGPRQNEKREFVGVDREAMDDIAQMVADSVAKLLQESFA